jgi:hypothetical protein
MLLQLAWVPFELDEVVRAAAPHMLAADWQAAGDNEMLLLQVGRSTQLFCAILAAQHVCDVASSVGMILESSCDHATCAQCFCCNNPHAQCRGNSVCVCAIVTQARIVLIESDACKLALRKLDQELVPPAGYNAAIHMPAAAAAAAVSGSFAGAAASVDAGPGAADVDDDGVRLPSATVEQLQRLLVEVRGNHCWPGLACAADMEISTPGWPVEVPCYLVMLWPGMLYYCYQLLPA